MIRSYFKHFSTTILALLALGLGIGVYAINWNANNFIDVSFWAQNPTSGDIRAAVFGNTTSPATTAYTKTWTNNICTGSSVSVQYVGTDSLPQQLAGNTIYVLTGNQGLTGTVEFLGNCIAILGSGNINITKNTGGVLGLNDHMFYAYGRQGIVIDSVALLGNNTDVANVGLTIDNSSHITIHDVYYDMFEDNAILAATSSGLVFNHLFVENSNFAIFLMQSAQFIMQDILASNNFNAISIGLSTGGILDHLSLESNDQIGLYIEGSDITVNNMRAMNNETQGYAGAWIVNSQRIALSNIQAINNDDDGIYINNSSGVLLHNFQSSLNGHNGLTIASSTGVYFNQGTLYSNNNRGYTVTTSDMVRFYGVNNIFSNNAGAFQVDINSNLAAGTSNDAIATSLARSAGSSNTSQPDHCMRTSEYSFGLQNIPDCTTVGWLGNLGSNAITIGDKVALQIAPVMWQSPTTVAITGSTNTSDILYYNTRNYIADNPLAGSIITTGGANYLSGNVHYTNSTGLTFYFSHGTASYIATGDISQTYVGTSSNYPVTIGMLRSTNDGPKELSGVFYGYRNSGFNNTYFETNYYRLYRWYDTTAPEAPVAIYPTTGTIFTGTSIDLIWDPAVDTGAGVTGYYYEVYNNSGFTNITHSGYVYGTTGVTINGLTVQTYYWRVRAFDNLAQTGSWNTGDMFTYGFSGFVLNANPVTGSTSTTISMTASGVDIDNNTATGYQGTVAWTTSGIDTAPNPNYTGFTTPSNYTFSGSDLGVHTFTNGIMINHPGIYLVTIYDINNPSWSGSTIVQVNGSYPAGFSGTLSVTPAYTSGAITVAMTGSQATTFDLGGGSIVPLTGDINPGTGFAYTLTTTTQGSHTITVTFATGYYVYTSSVSVIYDTIAPTITNITPTTGSTVTGSTVTLAWSGSEFGSASFSGYDILLTDGTNSYTFLGYNTQNIQANVTDGNRVLYITGTDQAGNIATGSSSFSVDNTAPTIDSVSGSQQVFTTLPFSLGWNVTDTGGYNYATVTIYDSNGNLIAGPTQTYQTGISTTNLGIGSLQNGLYTWYLTVYDNAGHSTTTGPITFAFLPALGGQIAGALTLSSNFGTVKFLTGQYYSNTTQLVATLVANMHLSASINGNITPNVAGISLIPPFPLATQAIQLTPGEGTKTLTTVFSTGALTPLSVVKTVILDQTAPNIFTLLSPANGASVTGAFTLDWSDSDDNVSGLSGYYYQVDNHSGFVSPEKTGWTTTSTVSLTTGGMNTGTYYWIVKAYDMVNNITTSETGSFVVVSTSIPNTTGTPNNFSFDDEEDADLDEAYTSNEITVTGLNVGQQVLASVSAGILLINGAPVGTTGLVDNGDEISVTLISSDEYDETVSTTVTIGTKSDTWSITTMEEDDDEDDEDSDLSKTQKLQIQLLFDLLVETYEDNLSRALAFFQTLANAIEDMLDDDDLSNNEEQALEYFLELIEDYIDDELSDEVVDELIYTAPNGKKYRVAFDETRDAYYSPDFIKPAFFNTKEAFAHYIDRQNPGANPGRFSEGILVGEGTNGQLPNLGNDVIVAPNGKVYRVTISAGKYTSPDFTYPRSFNSLTELRNYIIQHNK